MKLPKNIRGRLFLWYATSLISITAFFYLAVHIFSLPYGNVLFIVLLIALALEGYYIIRKMTDELTTLSSRIKTVTRENLSEKVTGIDSEDEIGELANSFNQLLDRLNKAFERERQFIGDVAHELKTPVSTLRGSIEVLLTRDRTKEEYKEELAELLKDINRLSTTIKNILDLAWSEADTARALKETVSLSGIAIQLKEVAIKMATAREITITGSIEKDVLVRGHEDKLFRAILNLIDNAISYTPEKGTVTLSVKKRARLAGAPAKREGQAIVQVKDTGVGIPEADLEHIFERFYRGSTRLPARQGTNKTFGSGLGLAIVQGIITAHRGTIEVESKVGKGTMFTISLPLA